MCTKISGRQKKLCLLSRNTQYTCTCIILGMYYVGIFMMNIYEPRCEKTGLRGFRPGPTQTGLYIYRRWLEALNFGFR